jgi:hypothetical protein
MTNSHPRRLAPRSDRALTFSIVGLALLYAENSLAQQGSAPKKVGAGRSQTHATTSDASPTTQTAAQPASPPPSSQTASGGDLPNLPMESTVDITDTREDPEQKYYFVGLRYRGTVIPQFLLNLFVNDGKTIYSNSIGAEVDIRHGGNSLIPWITYTDYNTGNILFYQKGNADQADNYSVVNSSLKAVYLGVDELWSIPLVPNKLDFEFGFGVGIGAVFGTLQNDWVSQTTTGPLRGSNGNYYTACTSTNAPPNLAGAAPNNDGCNPNNHSSRNPAKVGGYVEPNWLSGGVVPVFFPHISIPQLGLRFKPIKQLETRLSLGFGLTGFWFGASVDYGLEKTSDEHKAAARSRLHDHDAL